MIAAAAVCPHPPLLFRELNGADDAAAELRDACVAALGSVTACADRVVLLGGADESRNWPRGLLPDVAGFRGTAGGTGTGLPLSIGVGSRLLEISGWSGPASAVSIRWDAASGETSRLAETLVDGAERCALLVMGEGSARRGEHAPGHVDDRAFRFDDAVGRALSEGDAAALGRTDETLARELMAGGRAAWHVLARAVHVQRSSPRADTFYQDDPFGVMYHVVTWLLSPRRNPGGSVENG